MHVRCGASGCRPEGRQSARAHQQLTIQGWLQLHLYRGLAAVVIPPDGAFYLFPRTPDGDDAAFVKRAMDSLLLVAPGSTFGHPGHFRMAFCVDQRTVDLAVERLPEAG
ncbi:MAG: aminotransferase class I/II-fold pyridoxal phosphate-dependent enzyme [Thermoanaerobaculales bacterium]